MFINRCSSYSSCNYRPIRSNDNDLDEPSDGDEEEENEESQLDPRGESSFCQPVHYDCYAISNHSGTLHGGHYTAYCRHPFKGFDEEGRSVGLESWHLYNDRAVSGANPDHVVTGEAYLLFFERNVE